MIVGGDRVSHGIHKSVADARNKQVSAAAPVDRQENTDRDVKKKLPDGFNQRRALPLEDARGPKRRLINGHVGNPTKRNGPIESARRWP